MNSLQPEIKERINVLLKDIENKFNSQSSTMTDVSDLKVPMALNLQLQNGIKVHIPLPYALDCPASKYILNERIGDDVNIIYRIYK